MSLLLRAAKAISVWKDDSMACTIKYCALIVIGSHLSGNVQLFVSDHRVNELAWYVLGKCEVCAVRMLGVMFMG